jgi:hypothetical protein
MASLKESVGKRNAVGVNQTLITYSRLSATDDRVYGL